MTIVTDRDIKNEAHWKDLFNEWLIRADTTYLNHGSFGPTPEFVRLARRKWIDQLDCQPMDFYVRQLEDALWEARGTTAEFVGTNAENLIFAENATAGMNVVANSFPLKPGDEILSYNHEYGAVHRIWQRRCDQTGAELKVCVLPEQFESKQQVIDCVANSVTANTRLVIVSHITSPTALIMPVKEITKALQDKGVAVCVDGPHGPAHVDVDIDSIGCDFYTASCHKWLCATLGSGFLFVHPKRHANIEPPIKSWGRMLPAMPERWDEEFTWSGTRDPSPYLSIPAAIEFMNDKVGLETFRARSRYLASAAEEMLSEEFGTKPIAPRDEGWYASMAHVPLPGGDHSELQQCLWNEYQIEVPIIHFENRWFVRVSCHLYNNLKQLETLRLALRKFMI